MDTVGTALDPQQIEQMPRPIGREQLGEPDAALGSLEPTLSDTSAMDAPARSER
jgi:NADH-quinone oxidoreductase subunit J